MVRKEKYVHAHLGKRKVFSKAKILAGRSEIESKKDVCGDVLLNPLEIKGDSKQHKDRQQNNIKGCRKENSPDALEDAKGNG
ncbi:hypothetical protein AC623_14065 [Bacillus sp. FJAT-27231]|nr:hypothetical protein AC623_14065 [Bacillus sp. FJAT-27231]